MASWDIIVRTFFSDGGLSAGLAKANAALDRMGKAGPGARAGLRAVEIGARQLAFEAAGLQGGIGQLVRGFAMFGGGSALMLGVVAGIGGVALAYRALTKDTREAAAEQKKLQEELHRVAEARREARTPVSQRIATQQGQRGARFGELNAQIDAEMANLRANVGTRRFDYETDEQALQRMIAEDKTLQNLYRERRQLGQDIRSDRVSAADAAGKEADELKRAADEARRLKLEFIESQQTLAGIAKRTALGGLGFVAGPDGSLFVSEASRRAGRKPFEAPTFGAEGMGFGPHGPATFANIRGNIPRFVPADTVPKREPFPAAAVAAATVAMLGALQVGGVGGSLAGLGGLATALSGAKGLGALNPVGIGLTALGGVFSLFDHSQDRRQREMMEELRRIRENTDRRDQPDKTSVTILLNGKEVTGAILDDVIYGIRRAERRNAVPVLPPG